METFNPIEITDSFLVRIRELNLKLKGADNEEAESIRATIGCLMEEMRDVHSLPY